MNWTSASAAAVSAPETFTGATIRLFHAEVLVVIVPAYVLGDRSLAPVVVGAYHERFKRTIVLASVDRRGVPTYFGPAAIAAVLARIPFDALAWREYRFSRPKPMMLPIPAEPPAEDRSSSCVIDDADHMHSIASHSSQQRRTRTLIPDHELPETRR